MDLNGKVALITGGTRGIGAAAAIALGAAGANISIIGRTIDAEAHATADSIRAMGRRCELISADCSKPEAATRCIRDTVDLFGGLDVLIHSAGGPANGGLLEITPETWHSAFDIHIHAVFYLCRAAIPHMRERQGGAILLISSTAGKLATPSHITYQAVKGALPHLARGLAREFAPDNIRVNCIAPGVIRTRFHQQMTPEQKKLNLDHRIPLKKEGTSAQVAELMVAIIQNEYITGDTITIDGGLSMRIA